MLCPPLEVIYPTDDRSVTIETLRDGTIDVWITCDPAVEELDVGRGIALSIPNCIFCEHLLVGPPSNPAQLDLESDITTISHPYPQQ